MSRGNDPQGDAIPQDRRHGPRVLPLVVRTRSAIDSVFTRYVGPISTELCAEEFERWCEGDQVGPSALHRYISRLASYISEDQQRREFVALAARCIQLMTVTKA